MSRLKEICEYELNKNMLEGLEEIDIKKTLKENPVILSVLIGNYAHRNQLRVNGENYFNHPVSCLNIFLDMLNTNKENMYDIDFKLLFKLDLPFIGIYELCLLHDVIEDTDFTMSDLKDIFYECELYDLFDENIKEELTLLTHNKSEEYDIYLDRILTNKPASLVKMLDMMSNSRVYTLDKFGEKEYERGLYYYNSIYKINNKYHFVETFNTYRNNRKERAN